MTATASRATGPDATWTGVSIRSRRLAGAAALAVMIAAAPPASAKDETIFSNFMNALVPSPVAEPPAAETKAAPRKPDPRPMAILPRSSKKVAVAHPAAPSAVHETRSPDAATTTGAPGQPASPQPQPQPQTQQQQTRPPPQQQAQQSPQPAASAAPPAAPAAAKPAARPRAEAPAKAAPQSKPAPPATPAADADGEAGLFCRNITDAA